jgi:adenylylsulfate kinase
MTPKLQSKHNVLWQNYSITREHRENYFDKIKTRKHKGSVVWFTGLSGAGKSTIANTVEKYLFSGGCRTFVLDGDNIRHGLCKDLSFSIEDRRENMRRIAEVAKLFMEAGVITMTAFISPFRDERKDIRSNFNNDDFIEVFCDCPLQICEERDVKGLYSKAREGKIKEFTGITSPYEEPHNPDLTLNTAKTDLETCVKKVLDLLHEREILL